MNIFKKQGVAWCVTAVMIVVAIAIGTGKARTTAAEPVDREPVQTQGPVQQVESFYVFDEADVLSNKTEERLTERNLRLYDKLDVLIAVATVNYNGADLVDYAFSYGSRIGLGSYDFILLLDISGDDYCLVQGDELVPVFSDADCNDYLWTYLEPDFARGDYDAGVLSLTEALEDWCYDVF